MLAVAARCLLSSRCNLLSSLLPPSPPLSPPCFFLFPFFFFPSSPLLSSFFSSLCLSVAASSSLPSSALFSFVAPCCFLSFLLSWSSSSLSLLFSSSSPSLSPFSLVLGVLITLWDLASLESLSWLHVLPRRSYQLALHDPSLVADFIIEM